MQLVQFLSRLQEAPRAFSDASSEVCTTHGWDIFCCFSGRMLGGTVSTDIRVTSFHFASHVVILLTAHLLAGNFIRSGAQFISLIYLVTSGQLPYHIEIR